MVLSLACPGDSTSEAMDQPLSLESVYRAHFKPTWRLLRRLGVPPHQLDDAAQDVFLIVHRKLGDFDPRAPLRSWIYAIALRVAKEHRRRAARSHGQSPADVLADEAPGPAQLSEVQESVRLLHLLLAELDDKKRTVFVLAELEQLSTPEIALVLEENENTVYSRLRSARKAFEAALARQRAREARR
jgi:RNA polymerase sigma-70 factor (ECF subfamily)